jgi:hypothetical protein
MEKENNITDLIHITENRFREFMNKIPNASESNQNGEKIVNYQFYRKTDNNFSLSYHLKFNQKNVQFNFWFDKISYLNSKESISISFFDGNEPKEQFSLKNILTTSDFNFFKEKVEDIFIQYK